MSENTAIHLRVTGMTCGHCVAAVRRRSAPSPASPTSHVDLATGDVTVGSDRALTHDEVAAAIDEAGYQLAC